MQKTSQKVKIIPYCTVDGVATMRDSEVMDLFNRMMEDGTLDTVFPAGGIDTRDKFLRYMKFQANLYVVNIGGQIAWIAWLDRFENRTAHFTFCVFSDFWGTGRTVNLPGARMVIRRLFGLTDQSGMFLYNAFLGRMDPENLKAVTIAKAVGFKGLCVIPDGLWHQKKNKSGPALLVCFSRSELEKEGAKDENL